MNTVNQKLNDMPEMDEVVAAGMELEAAWLWFAGQVNSDEARRYCFERALLANPNSTIAQQGLAALSQTPAPATPRKVAFNFNLGRLFWRRTSSETVTSLP